MTDDELEAIRKRVMTYRKTYPWKLRGKGKDFIAQDRDALLTEVERLRALVGETEWEYGARLPGQAPYMRGRSDVEQVIEHAVDRAEVVRRHPGRDPGPWEPVPETGDNRG